jgi:chromate transporter
MFEIAGASLLPGPNIVNLCAVFGVRMRGIPGALVCLVGLLGPSVMLMIAAGTLCRRFGALPELAQSLTDRQFSELFAIAQAAPGPNIMFVALLGHFIAGVPGAVVATMAMCGPSCVLAYAVSQVAEHFRQARWRIAIQAGPVPVTIGLIAASALIIAQGADRDWACVAITATTFALVYWTRISPLVAFACAALLGLGGFV